MRTSTKRNRSGQVTYKDRGGLRLVTGKTFSTVYRENSDLFGSTWIMTVVQWLASQQEGPGLKPQIGCGTYSICVEFACSPIVCLAFLPLSTIGLG